VDRDLTEVTSSRHVQRYLVDMVGSEVDDEAQACLSELKTVKLADTVSPDSSIRLQYTEPNDEAIRSHQALLFCIGWRSAKRPLFSVFLSQSQWQISVIALQVTSLIGWRCRRVS